MTADVASVQDILTDIGILTVEHDHLVRGIDVEALAKREGRGVVIQGGIRGRVVNGNGRVRETCDKLLNIAYALDSAQRRAEGRSVPEVQVHSKM